MILDKICFGDNEHSSISFISVGRGYSQYNDSKWNVIHSVS